MRNTTLVLSCEHANNLIPKAYQHAFAYAKNALNSHRGYDKGALQIFDVFKSKFNNKHLAGEQSRLLIDLNRSESASSLFSQYTQKLSASEKQHIIEQIYRPFRNTIKTWIDTALSNHTTALHLSMHSFTPELNGKIRSTDIGLLYHPDFSQEKDLCRAWAKHLKVALPDYHIHMNRPYQGKSDGHTQSLRQMHKGKSYIGIELEVNQKHLRHPKKVTKLAQILAETFESACLDLNYAIN